jgi:hypothetical protein
MSRLMFSGEMRENFEEFCSQGNFPEHQADRLPNETYYLSVTILDNRLMIKRLCLTFHLISP